MNQIDDIFVYGGIDTDSEDRAIAKGDYRDALYLTGGTPQGGDGSALSTFRGGLERPNTLPTGVNTFVGGCEWTERNKLVLCYHNAAGNHTVWLYDIFTFVFTLVLQSPILNFRVDRYLVGCFVIDGVFYYSDGYFNSFAQIQPNIFGYNPPRKINLDRAIAGQYGTDTFQKLDVITWPPRFAPQVEYLTIANQTQRLYGALYQFAYRYIYDGEQESAFSPLSELPLPINGYWMSGQNLFAVNGDNAILVQVNTGSSAVLKIEIAYRKGNNGNYTIYETIDKIAEGIGNNILYTSEFNNTIAGEVLPLVQENFDLVPQIAKRQALLPKSQIAYANIYEDYTSECNFSCEYTVKTVRKQGKAIGAAVPLIRFINDNTAKTVTYNLLPTEMGGVFGFNQGDIISLQLRRWNGIQLEGAETFSFEVTTQTSATAIQTAIAAFLTAQGFTVTTPVANIFVVFDAITTEATNSGLISVNIPVHPLRTFKDNTTYEIGIKYEDRGNREGTTLRSITTDAGKVEIPTYSVVGNDSVFPNVNEPFTIGIRGSVLSQAPDWATHYRVMMREKRHNFGYYMIKQVATVPDNPYRFAVTLENAYLLTFGVKPAHEIKVGDKVRFIREAPRFEAGLDYVPNYVEDNADFELSVSSIELGAGVGGGDLVTMEWFDINLFASWLVNGNANGSLIEISSVEVLPEEGIWYETEASFPIVNAHQSNRRHGGQIERLVDGLVIVNANQIRVSGEPLLIVGYVIDQYFSDGTFAASGVITSFSYNATTNETTINLSTVILTATIFEVNLSQTSTLPAIFNLDGDVYLRMRRRETNISVNGWRYIRLWELDPSYSDYFASKEFSRGRIGFSDLSTKRKHLKATVVHSGNFLDNSRNNRLNKFRFQDRVNLIEEYGSINGLILDGFTLMAIQDRKNTSIYIGANMVVDASGQGQLLTTSEVFSNPRERSENFGTLHGESVILTDMGVMYYDYLNAQMVLATSNAQTPITKGKFKFNAGITTLTEDISATSQVIAYQNKAQNEVVFYFKEVNNHIVFSTERQRWVSRYIHPINGAVNTGIFSYIVANAKLFELGKGDFNEYNEVVYEPIVTVSNSAPSDIVKILKTVGLKTTGRWELTEAVTPENATYGEMSTYIPENLFRQLEGNLWASYRNDVNSPNFATPILAWAEGRPLRGVSFTQKFTCKSAGKVVLFTIRVVTTPSPSLI